MTSPNINDLAERVSSKDEFVAFAAELARQIARGEIRVENDRPDTYVEAMSAWLAASGGYYRNIGVDTATVSPWRLFASTLVAGLIYE